MKSVKISNHEFIEGDCLKAMKKLSDGSLSTVVTSPPYNIGVNYNTYNDSTERGDYLNWIKKVSAEIYRLLEDDGSFFINMGSKPSDPWVAHEVAKTISEIFTLQNTIHWIKAISIDEDQMEKSLNHKKTLSVGHYKPINSNRFVNDCHEYVFHFSKNGEVPLERLSVGVPYSDQSNIKRWNKAKGGLRCRGNTWFIPYKTIQSRDAERPHPASFPEKLVEMCLKLHGIEYIDTVLDPFAGIGTTALACENLGLNSIGIELDSYYLATAKDRMRKKIKKSSSLEKRPKPLQAA